MASIGQPSLPAKAPAAEGERGSVSQFDEGLTRSATMELTRPDIENGRSGSRLRIFLADDHAVVRAGLKSLINAECDMEVVGEAANGRDACDRIAVAPPDVVVLDVTMPELTGAQVTQKLRQRHPHIRVLALTVHEDGGYLRQLLQAGASGYILKRAASEELIRAIRAVAAGETYIDSRVAGNLVSTFVDPKVARALPGVELSEREAQVIRLIAQGFTNKEVAAKLGVSAKTIETYKTRSMDKLGLHGRVDLVQVAVERGWLRGRPQNGAHAPVTGGPARESAGGS